MTDAINNATNAVASIIPLALTVGIVKNVLPHPQYKKKKKKCDGWLSGW